MNASFDTTFYTKNENIGTHSHLYERKKKARIRTSIVQKSMKKQLDLTEMVTKLNIPKCQ